MSDLVKKLRTECIGQAASDAADRIETLEGAVREAMGLLDREDGRSSSTVDIAVDILDVALNGKLSE
jgi:hypothetical protein